MLTIKTEVSGGANIEASFREALRLANQLRCFVEFNFNGVTCIAHPNGNMAKGIDAYFNQVNSENQYKLAMT